MDSEHYSFPPKTIDDLFKYCKHWIATNDPDKRYKNWTDFYNKVKEEQEKEEEKEEKRVYADEKRIMNARLEIGKKKERLRKERLKNERKKNKKSVSGRATPSARIGGKKKRKSRRHIKKKGIKQTR